MSGSLDQQLRQATDALIETKTRLRGALIEHAKAVYRFDYTWYHYVSFHVRRGARWYNSAEREAAVYREGGVMYDLLYDAEVELRRAQSEVEIAEAKWQHLYLQFQASQLRG